MSRPLKFKTKEKLQKEIDKYFKSCFTHKRDSHGTKLREREWINVQEYAVNPESTQKIYKYGDYIMEQTKPFTVSGLASYLKTSRETLMNYEKREEFFDTIIEAKDRIYAYTEESLFSGNSNGAKFSLINNYSWKDKQEIDQTVTHQPVTIVNDVKSS